MVFGRIACVLAGLVLAATVQAQALRSPTLDKISANGTIYIGYSDASIPFPT